MITPKIDAPTLPQHPLAGSAAFSATKIAISALTPFAAVTVTVQAPLPTATTLPLASTVATLSLLYENVTLLSVASLVLIV